MIPRHPDCLPYGPYYRVRTSSKITDFILDGRWYNWSMDLQSEIAADVRRNKTVEICHTPLGVWLKFLAVNPHNNIETICEIFVMLSDIVMLTKKFEIQILM